MSGICIGLLWCIVLLMLPESLAVVLFIVHKPACLQ